VTDLPSQTPPRLARRTVLAVGAAGVGSVALAACGGGGTSAATRPKKDSRLTALSAVPVGGAVKVDLGGSPVIVARPTASQTVAFSAICTHQGCVVDPVGRTLNCPCHGSQFNALTGQVLQGPAVDPLPRIPVTVKNGEVVTT
jgi:nitrite reductase/ring-hydroxylating ferredoxin subunit